MRVLFCSTRWRYGEITFKKYVLIKNRTSCRKSIRVLQRIIFIAKRGTCYRKVCIINYYRMYESTPAPTIKPLLKTLCCISIIFICSFIHYPDSRIILNPNSRRFSYQFPAENYQI